MPESLTARVPPGRKDPVQGALRGSVKGLTVSESGQDAVGAPLIFATFCARKRNISPPANKADFFFATIAAVTESGAAETVFGDAHAPGEFRLGFTSPI